MATRALGLPSLAHPQLDDRAARSRLRRWRSGRVHDGHAGGRVLRRVPPAVRSAGADARDRSQRSPDGRGLRRLRRQRSLAVRRRRGGDRGVEPTPRCPRSPPNGPRRSNRSLRSSTEARRSSIVHGEVLVVGASASGVQIADELRRSGHEVTIAVGEHVRVPRWYRGRDIYWWMDAIGQLDERYDEVDDVDRARRHTSVQVVGNDEGRDLGLNSSAGERRPRGRADHGRRGHQGAVLGRAHQPRCQRRPEAGAPAPAHRRVRVGATAWTAMSARRRRPLGPSSTMYPPSWTCLGSRRWSGRRDTARPTSGWTRPRSVRRTALLTTEASVACLACISWASRSCGVGGPT